MTAAHRSVTHELVEDLLEKTLAELRAGVITPVTVAIEDEERFAFRVAFLGGAIQGAPEETQPARDACPACGSTDLRLVDIAAGEVICMACTVTWTPQRPPEPPSTT